jgi:hypothetical protein
MNTAVRIFLVFFSFVGSWLLIYWLPLSFIPGVHNIPLLPNIVSLLLATGIGIFVWKKTNGVSGSMGKYIFLGGIIVGSISFLLGFIGPIIFNPSANQGPMLGIFITGPAGFLIGLIGGAIYWLIKIKKQKLPD